VAGLVLVVLSGVAPTLGAASSAWAVDQPGAAPALGEEDAALSQAQATGSPVELASRTTATERYLVKPSGERLAELSATPVRVPTGAGWREVDTTLVRRPDGSVGPIAAAVDLSFSGGGDAPLLRLADEGAAFSLTWPGALPVPTLSGSQATYPDVLPGVDVVLTATATSYSQVLVVKDQAAAASPALNAIAYGVQVQGGELRELADDRHVVVTPSGEQVLAGGTPLMWDSSGDRTRDPADPLGTAQDDRVVAAAPGDTVAVVPSQVTATALTLRPDPAILRSSSTVFPVYIDPYMAADDRTKWAMVDEYFPDSEYYNWTSADQGVGYQDYTGHSRKRQLYVFNTNEISGKQIRTAVFSAFETHSASCNRRPVDLWLIGDFNSATNWRNQPVWGRVLDSQNVANGYTTCSPGGASVEWGALSAVQDAANYYWGTVGLGLRAADENDRLAWKKFRNDAVLTVTYNSVPNPPQGLGTVSPVSSCAGGAGRPILSQGTDGPTLLATLTDPDADNSLAGEFEWWVTNGARVGVVSTTAQVTGSQHAVVLPRLGDGNWSWRVRSWDGYANSPWATWCEFTIDTTPPVSVPTVTSSQYPEDSYVALTAGTFVFGPNSAADVSGYTYSIDGVVGPTSLTAGSDGQATMTFTPPGPGRFALNVRSQDRALNLGPLRVYYVRVLAPANQPVAAWKLDEQATATVAVDSVAGLAAGLRNGPTFAVDGGRNQVTGAPTDGALHLDNINDEAMVDGAVIDTRAAFTLMAWVKIPSVTATSGPTDDRAILSQEGAVRAAAWLGYDADAFADSDPNTRNGTFVLRMPTADTAGSPVIQAQADAAIVNDAIQIDAGNFNGYIHVAGVYNGTGTLSIFINGRLAGTAGGLTTAWKSSTSFRLGAGRVAGGDAFMGGYLDAVRIFPQALTASAIKSQSFAL